MFSAIVHLLKRFILRGKGGQKFLHIQLDITNVCNLSCTHCYHPHHKNTGALRFREWLEILNQYQKLLKKLHLRPVITICGGEPIASPMLIPLLAEVNNRWPGIKVFILTNGTLIQELIIEKIKIYNVTVQVSIDGPDAKRHDFYRGFGAFNKATNGISLLRKHKIPVLLLSILSRNTSAWSEDFFKLASSLNVNAMNFTRFIPTGYGAKLQFSGKDQELRGLELKTALEQVIFHSKTAKVRTNTDQPLYHLIDKNLGANQKFGFQGIIVDYQGNLKVSSRSDYVLGNILKEDLEKLFLYHPIMKALRAGKIEGCGQCKHYARCGGDRNISYAITRSLLSADPACWIADSSKEPIKEKISEVS